MAAVAVSLGPSALAIEPKNATRDRCRTSLPRTCGFSLDAIRSTRRVVSLRASVQSESFFRPFGSSPQRTNVAQLAREEEKPIQLGWKRFDPSQFELMEELGHGSFGTVFSAVDVDTGSRVAIKKIHKTRKNQPPTRTANKIKREANLLQRLQGASENVVHFYGCFEDEWNVYLIMEVLSGGTLEDYQSVCGGSIPEKECKWITTDILNFVASCHKENIVYADAKPANFMIDTSTGVRRVKAIDMGCSQALASASDRLELRSGTPLYFAPEVFQRSYSKEADLWSVGVILYQLVTGRNPWFKSLRGVAPNDVMQKVLYQDIVYDPDEWRRVSPEFLDLVQKLLAKRASERLTAVQALRHPWLMSEIHRSEEEGPCMNNVVPLCDRTLAAVVNRHMRAQHS